MISRIAIGSAQFGMPYGVANQGRGAVGEAEVGAILNHATSIGIDTIDTAISYGDSETVLGRAGVKNYRIVSKISDVPQGNIDVEKWVETQIHGSIERLGIERLHAVLFHKPDQLLGAGGAKFCEAVQSLKLAGHIEKIGISVYAPTELPALIENFDIDLVQAPLNVLDQRLIESGWLSALKQRGIELHTRSAFLQGLLLMNATERPRIFERWQALWQEWEQWLEDVEMTPLQACIRFSLSIAGVDRVIVGVNSLHQFQQVLSASSGVAPKPPKWTASVPPELINPSLWSAL